MSLYIVIGPPAAGKSTYVAEHATEGEITVDYDQLAQALGNRTRHDAISPIREAAYTARQAAIDAILDHGWDAWIIHGNPSDEQMDVYEQADAVFVLIDPGREQTIKQAEQDQRSKQTFEQIDQWYEQPPHLPDTPAPDEPEEETGPKHQTCKGGSPMLTKTVSTPIKAKDGDGGTVTFDGYAAVFDNIDLGGDKIIKGAFADTLKTRYPNEGEGIPVYWDHEMTDPFKNLGLTTKAVEDDHGLHVTGQIDQSTDIGRQVAKLLKEGRVGQMSFAFDVNDGAWVDGRKRDDGSYEPGYYELRALDLYEVSICPIGMNQQTEVSAKKAILGLDPDEEPQPQPHHQKETCPAVTPRLGLAARRLQIINL